MFVHAHPDDETLTTGVTMGAYAARGHDVHLLTCTLGEEGEVIPPALAHLGAGRDDTLGPWRREELRAAMSVLGVSHSVLGEVSERLAPKIEEAQAQLAAVNNRVKGFIRAYPGATLLGVAGLGFILGRLASRK